MDEHWQFLKEFSLKADTHGVSRYIEIHGEGNSNSSPCIPDDPKSIKDTQSRKWCWVINNYKIHQIQHIKDKLAKHKYVFQQEIGEENGTPHLQGYVEAKSPIKFSTLKKIIEGGHLMKAKGDIRANWEYCTKEDTRDPNGHTYCNFAEPYVEKPTVLDSTKLYKWQKDIEDQFKLPNDEVDPRKINWIYDEKGNLGKTSFAKYCSFHNLATLLRNGKANDIASMILLQEKTCRDFIFDFTRSTEGCISYQTLESVKDGIIISTKYEGGRKLITTPIIYVFANFYPDENKMSMDRWNVIDAETLLK